MQTVTLSESWREAGPVAITAPNLRTCVDHFYRARELVTSVSGRAPLPVDTVAASRSARRPAGATRRAPRSPAAQDRRPVKATRTPAPAVVALVHGDERGMLTKWAARAIMRRPDVSVLVCPWWHIRFTDHGAVADRQVWKADRKHGVLRRAIISNVPIDIMLGIGGTRDNRPYSKAEQQALRRLAPLQIVRDGMRRRQIIRQLLLEASRRGVVTSGSEGLARSSCRCRMP